ncbi:hypothetical protein [Paenibacillus bovis]|uniref:hypothetical protein n=1 Tax=Paenibacillus bovis TaxID=1616788 RepID=UPI0013966788|nr:hypothetical protein [Paenibacillus bovis]
MLFVVLSIYAHPAQAASLRGAAEGFPVLAGVVHPDMLVASAAGGGGGGGGGAAGGASGGASGGAASDGGGGGDAWYIPQWVTDLMEKVDAMLKTFQDLMSGKLIYDAINSVVILWANDSVEPIMDLFARSFLFTPRVAEMVFVQNAWSIFMTISFVLMVVAVLLLAYSLIRGNKAPGPILKNFMICFVCSVLSLTIINIINVGVNGFTATSLESMVGGTGIDYKNISGDNVLKSMVVGGKALSDPTFKEQTLTQTLSAEKGGIFTMFLFLLTVVDTMTLMTFIKLIAIVLLSILSPVYVSISAMLGRIDPITGFLNLFVRTTLAGYLMALFWGWSVKLQNQTLNQEGWLYDLGIPATWFICFLALVASFILYNQWLRPLWFAMSDPVTLGGGATLEGLGIAGNHLADFIGHVGSQFGLTGLQKKAKSWSDKSKSMADQGRRMREERERQMQNRMNGNKSSRSRYQQAINDPQADMYLQEPAAADWVQSIETLEDEDIAPASFRGLSLLDSGRSLQKTMDAAGFTRQTSVQLAAGAEEAAQQWIHNLPKGLRAQVSSLDGRSLMITGDPTQLLKNLEDAELGYDLQSSQYLNEGVSVDANTGRIHADNSESSRAVLDQLAHDQDTYQRVNMPYAEAKAALKQAQKEGASWTKYADLRSDGLWVHSSDIEQAMLDLGKARGTTTKVMRVELPPDSRFLNEMLDTWEKSGKYNELLEAIETSDSDTELFVRADQYEAFEQAYNDYRKGRRPYWTTRSGEVKVIQDQTAITYGSAPTNGLDMGSFENYVKRRVKKERAGESAHVNRKMNSKPEEAPHIWEAAAAPLPVILSELPSTAHPNYKKPSRVQRMEGNWSVKSAEMLPVAIPEATSGAAPGMIASNKLPMRRNGDHTDAMRISSRPRPAKLQGKGQSKMAMKGYQLPATAAAAAPAPVGSVSGGSVLPMRRSGDSSDAARLSDHPRPSRVQHTGNRKLKMNAYRMESPSSESPAAAPVKNEAQKAVAKQAAKDGAGAAVRSGAVAAGATLLSTGSLKAAGSQGLKAGAKAGAKAAQKRVQQEGAKAAASDAAKSTLPKRGTRKKKE